MQNHLNDRNAGEQYAVTCLTSDRWTSRRYTRLLFMLYGCQQKIRVARFVVSGTPDLLNCLGIPLTMEAQHGTDTGGTSPDREHGIVGLEAETLCSRSAAKYW